VKEATPRWNLSYEACWIPALDPERPGAGGNGSQEVYLILRFKVIGGLAAAVVLVVAWYLFRPELLLIDRTVSEGFPEAPSGQGVDEPSRPRTLAAGRFHSLAHETNGVATIYRLPEGQRLLRLTEFETSNGPDVRVYLVAAKDAADGETVTRSGFIDLGAMKGNRGDQNYTIPEGTDLSRYRAVSIWCRRFSVNFGTAPLTGP